ncbi:methyltransferase, partial [Acinetobacter baumannii]
MFPQLDQKQQVFKKQVQDKKQMQLLHLLLPEDGERDLGEHLQELAKKVSKRVFVNGPSHAIFLSNHEPA